MILAFDLSSRRGGIALWGDAKLIARVQWDDPDARHLEFWRQLKTLADRFIEDWRAVDAVVAGRGPGSYAGMRGALIAARMLAAPGPARAIALDSGASLAAAWFRRHPEGGQPLVVAGDARRGAVWYAVFERGAGEMILKVSDWALAPAADFLARLPRDAVIVSSDPSRLIASLAAVARNAAVEEAFPDPAELAREAGRRLACGEDGEPFEPLYMHPPL